MRTPTAATAQADGKLRIASSSLMLKLFSGFAVLALVSAAIGAAGKWLGHPIAMAGYTDAATLREVVIGNNVLAVPENAMRFAQARQDGVASRLDLYLNWPDLAGYSEAARAQFTHSDGSRRILFLTFEKQSMSRDMSGRFDPIYSALIAKPGAPGPAGTTMYDFAPASGYVNEVLVVAERAGEPPFVARCLSGPSAQESLAPCERDVLIGPDLSLTYRFPRELLEQWETLDRTVTAKASGFLRTVK